MQHIMMKFIVICVIVFRIHINTNAPKTTQLLFCLSVCCKCRPPLLAIEKSPAHCQRPRYFQAMDQHEELKQHCNVQRLNMNLLLVRKNVRFKGPFHGSESIFRAKKISFCCCHDRVQIFQPASSRVLFWEMRTVLPLIN